MNPLGALIVSQPGMADRLLAEHADDGHVCCRVCTCGGQAARQRWPCTIHSCATQAVRMQRADTLP